MNNLNSKPINVGHIANCKYQYFHDLQIVEVLILLNCMIIMPCDLFCNLMYTFDFNSAHSTGCFNE